MTVTFDDPEIVVGGDEFVMRGILRVFFQDTTSTCLPH